MLQEQIGLPVGATVRGLHGDHYMVEALLGKGGFSAVYLVRDRRDKQRTFALKEVIDPEPHELKSLVFEGELLKRLNHRALPHVQQVFTNEKLKRFYLLMDYVNGKDLAFLRKQQSEERFSLPLVLALLEPIVDAVTYLHQQDPPIVHRDIKPANIIIPAGAEEAVLVDLGSAKEYRMQEGTNTLRFGSPGYAAPEQYGRGTNPRTDIYGLAATLYTLLTGVVPPDALTRLVEAKQKDPLIPVNQIVPTLPNGVAEVIQRGMNLDYQERHATIEEFWQEVSAAALQSDVVPAQLLAETWQSFSSIKQDIEHSTTALLHKQQPLHRLYTWKYSIAIFFLLLLVLGTGALLAATLFHPTGAVNNKNTHTQHLTTSTAAPSSTVKASLYPTLATSYSGTIFDVSVAKEKTPLYLTNIQQDGGTLSGNYQGLGQAGPFSGSVTKNGAVVMKMPIQAGTEMLVLHGTIKVGGDITGDFDVANQQGQSTGEVGIWNVSATAQ